MLSDELTPTETLLYFDEPLIFLSAAGARLLLCSKIDEESGLGRYLVVPTSKGLISQLKDGRVSLREAFSQAWCWIIDTNACFEIVRSESHALEDVPASFFPEPGVGLYERHGLIRDRFCDAVESHPFLSVRFKGGELGAATIGFGVFKGLMDEAYAALRNIFVPAVDKLTSFSLSENAVARILQIPLLPPRFASLSIQIGQPTLDLQSVKKHIHVDAGNASAAMDAAAMSFMRDLENIADSALRNRVYEEFSDGQCSALGAVARIVPDTGSHFSEVEIHGPSSGGRGRPIIVDMVSGTKIRAAYQRIAQTDESATGFIVELNERSGTFVLRDQIAREVTCITQTATMKEAMAAFAGRKRIVVAGSRQRRKRRDIMRVKTVRPDGD